MTWQIIKDGTFVFPIFMADTADHLTGATGKTVTVQLSKNGGAFGAASGSIAEVSGGWYKLTANATDLNTEGALVIEASATGCDKWRDLAHVYTVQNVNVKQVNGSAVTGVNDFKADVSALALQATLTSVKTATDKLTFNAANVILADVREVNDSAVTGVNDFKADVSALALQATLTSVKTATDKLTFNAANVILADVREVNDSAVTGVNDFKANVSGLSTFDPSTTGVKLTAAGLNDVTATVPSAKPFNFPQMLVMLYQRVYGPTELDAGAGTITVYGDDGTTGIVYQDVDDTGTVQTQSLAQNVP